MAVQRLGFTELSGGKERTGPFKVNIIFVHGLRGNPQHTWEGSRVSPADAAPGEKKRRWLTFFMSNDNTAGGSSTTSESSSFVSSGTIFWPDEYLTEDIPEARVWTYGYNADAIGGMFQPNNQNSISQHGRDFAVELNREIDNELPILFVAHSLGGIITKDAMRRSKGLHSRTSLIVFLGTPHRGSAYAEWGQIASNLASLGLQDSNKKRVQTLEVNSEILDNIHEQFKTIVFESSIRIHSFQEARGISGMKGLHNKVVDDFRSKLDLPEAIETVESIDANHMQMARCSDRKDPQYRKIIGVLKKRLRNMASQGDGVEARQEDILTAPNMIGGSAPDTSNATEPCHYIPLPNNKRFVGRQKILKKLKDSLFVNESPKVAVVGLGGVGKTQVALQVAHWTKENKPEYSVFWVPALSDASFEQSCAAIATKLGVSKTEDEEDPRKIVQRYLSSEAAGKWLLVVDNADDAELLFGLSDKPGGFSKYLPSSHNGVTLFTTRSREVAVSVAGIDVVDLSEMDSEEAKRFWGDSLTRKELLRDEALTTVLLEKLTYLPLAITQAAAYINTKQLPIAEYLELLNGTEKDIAGLMSREFVDSSRYRGSQNAVATTWLVSFDQIRKSDDAAAKLLDFISCIEPKGIPQSLLPEFESTEELVNAIGTLRAYAFLNRRGDSKVFDMHSLVHLAARIWIQREGRIPTVLEGATRDLATVFPIGAKHEDRHLWREYLPHAFKILQQGKELETEHNARLRQAVGCCLQVEGRIKEAVMYLEQAFQWANTHLTGERPLRLAFMHALAGAYESDGQIKKAVELLEQVVTITKRVQAEDHPNRLAYMHALAGAYKSDGQIKKAVELLEQVVTITKRVLAKDHPNRLASMHALAGAYKSDGQIKKAVELLEQVVTITNRVLAKDHPNRLASMHVLAGAYKSDGQIKKAVELLEQVVTITNRVLAEDHPDRLASLHNLAVCYYNLPCSPFDNFKQKVGVLFCASQSVHLLT
ncbi:hypothetical protein B0H63DRAFT_182369 [Podospora didyma]|uniref:NB-ARC domain-containing protein n=1 Tax=Podospora didyma TaxID=330526 RepID=A0AAE0TZL6_9PEZI|nr:hypothetical protein B0H63DRAFT_182369 [Podospora didyma]